MKVAKVGGKKYGFLSVYNCRRRSLLIRYLFMPEVIVNFRFIVFIKCLNRNQLYYRYWLSWSDVNPIIQLLVYFDWPFVQHISKTIQTFRPRHCTYTDTILGTITCIHTTRSNWQGRMAPIILGGWKDERTDIPLFPPRVAPEGIRLYTKRKTFLVSRWCLNLSHEAILR